MKTGSYKIAILVAAGLAAAACSTVEWTHPSKSPDQMTADRQECAAIAMREADRIARRQPLSEPGTGGGTIGGEYDQAMARYDLTQFRDKLIANCMEGRGYRRTTKPFF